MRRFTREEALIKALEFAVQELEGADRRRIFFPNDSSSECSMEDEAEMKKAVHAAATRIRNVTPPRS